jgi:hypothetical protein
MNWAGYLECMRKVTIMCKVLVGKPERKRHLLDIGTNGRKILKWILRETGLFCELTLSNSGQRPVGKSCERGNEPLGSIKARIS